MSAAFAVEESSGREPFRFVLRRETRAGHAALDGHPAFSSLLDGTLDLCGYRRLMVMLHGFYARNDAILAEACRRHALGSLGYVYAPRAGILRGDLTGLGTRSVPVSWEAPEPAPLAYFDSAGTLAGVLYVLEGSVLGGSVLCRAAETLLAHTGVSGLAYWQWCREAGGARWAMTCAMLEGLASSESERRDMIAGAHAGFAGFEAWFRRWSSDLVREMSVARC
jgi:heme oxygenase